MNILITGATGNVGLSVISNIRFQEDNLRVFAGVRNIATDKQKLTDYPVSLILFDFENVQTYQPAFQGIDILFLLRPPQISNVSKVFKPLIDQARQSKIKQIIFLSVQGVENSKIIPHHKIEKLITSSNVGFTFLRPAYFMQNFTTTLNHDLIHNQKIYLPAGHAKFTIVDVSDIGAVAAKILAEPQSHLNKSYELTNNETLTFTEMADKISKGTGKHVNFISPNLVAFYMTKRREKVPPTFILIMIMLHYFPRFQKTPKTTDWVEIITGQKPKTFDEFVIANRNQLR